jgi:hypothetical protein
MSATKTLAQKKNLLLCLDAFGTLFTPCLPIPVAYAHAAASHGINIGDPNNPTEVSSRFKSAFKTASQENPNYGKATGMGAEKWWASIIENTFTPFLRPNQTFPHALTQELLHTYSSSKGYDLYPDVRPFFNMLRFANKRAKQNRTPLGLWPWDQTIVGIITNSDNRVPSAHAATASRIIKPLTQPTTYISPFYPTTSASKNQIDVSSPPQKKC